MIVGTGFTSAASASLRGNSTLRREKGQYFKAQHKSLHGQVLQQNRLSPLQERKERAQQQNRILLKIYWLILAVAVVIISIVSQVLSIQVSL